MKPTTCDRCKSDSVKVRGMPKEFAEHQACEKCRSEIFQILEQYDQSVRAFHEQGRRDAFYDWWVKYNPQMPGTPENQLVTAHAAADYQIDVPPHVGESVMRTSEITASESQESQESHPVVESTDAFGGNG